MSAKVKERKNARTLIVQSLYEHAISQNPTQQIMDHALQGAPALDREYYTEVFLAVVHNLEALDELIAPFLSRKPKEVDPIELSVLRLATYELQTRLDVPYRVVINEALENTKKYGSSDGHKFVNGVLDKIAKAHRQEETQRNRK